MPAEGEAEGLPAIDPKHRALPGPGQVEEGAVDGHVLPSWARRVVELGLGATVAYSAITEESLTNALRQALDPAVVARARACMAHVRADGAAIAARELEEHFGTARA